jgi:hypothetical protein
MHQSSIQGRQGFRKFPDLGPSKGRCT